MTDCCISEGQDMPADNDGSQDTWSSMGRCVWAVMLAHISRPFRNCEICYIVVFQLRYFRQILVDCCSLLLFMCEVVCIQIYVCG